MRSKEIPDYIKKLDDKQVQVEKYVELLYGLQRSRGPVIETVTLIRFEKPVVYSILKRRFQYNKGLNMLFNLSLDYDQALKNLQHSTFYY